MSATAHVRQVASQHALACRQYPLEGTWATRMVKRTLAEYPLADRIYVASRYVRESFLAQGVRDELLADFPLTPDPRYAGDGGARSSSSAFEIVYIGTLTVVKGVPLLIDAVRSLPHLDLRLTLVGGWTTRAMRRFLERASSQDPRIVIARGDPLPHLRGARLYVHPSYSDGFGYAAAEALSCGIPVIVSEDTGMKDLLGVEGANGLILPTGDRGALAGAIDAAYRGEVLGTPRAGA